MAGSQAGPVVAVEVFVKQQAIAPVRIVLKLAGSSKDGTSSVVIFEEQARQPPRDLLGDLIQVHLPSGSGGALDGKVVAVIAVILQQGTDDQSIDRHPDRAAPIRIAAEHARIGLRRQIGDAVFLAAGLDDVRMVGVVARQRADARTG